jgi:hypothetical protein
MKIEKQIFILLYLCNPLMIAAQTTGSSGLMKIRMRLMPIRVRSSIPPAAQNYIVSNHSSIAKHKRPCLAQVSLLKTGFRVQRC